MEARPVDIRLRHLPQNAERSTGVPTKTIDGSQNSVKRSATEECTSENSVQRSATGGLYSRYTVLWSAIYHRSTKNLYSVLRPEECIRCTVYSAPRPEECTSLYSVPWPTVYLAVHGRVPKPALGCFTQVAKGKFVLRNSTGVWKTDEKKYSESKRPQIPVRKTRSNEKILYKNQPVEEVQKSPSTTYWSWVTIIASALQTPRL